MFVLVKKIVVFWSMELLLLVSKSTFTIKIENMVGLRFFDTHFIKANMMLWVSIFCIYTLYKKLILGETQLEHNDRIVVGSTHIWICMDTQLFINIFFWKSNIHNLYVFLSYLQLLSPKSSWKRYRQEALPTDYLRVCTGRGNYIFIKRNQMKI